MDSHLSRDLEGHNMKTMAAVSVLVSARLIRRVRCAVPSFPKTEQLLSILHGRKFFYRKSTCKLVIFLCGNFVCEVYLFIYLFIIIIFFIFIFTVCRYLCFR